MAFLYAIALTGSIATGKSTVASLMALNGMRVIDADSISHEILEANAQWVKENFGEEFVKNGKVDRPALGKLIFSDKVLLRTRPRLLKRNSKSFCIR